MTRTEIISAEAGEEGRYVHFPAPGGSCPIGGPDDAATPGTDFYRIRRILGEHALRYLDENPLAAMRLSNPEQSRIHTINYELDETERRQASNNDYHIRGTIGLIWRLIESLRIRPAGTPRTTYRVDGLPGRT